MLDHAAAAFADGSGTLNLSFGTVGRGTSTRQFQIENLPAAFRAGLDLDSIGPIANPSVFSTDAVPFLDLAPRATSSTFDLFLDTSQLGDFSGEYQFNLSDEKDLSGHAGQQTLILNVSATVVPEPGTLALLIACTVSLRGYVQRRRRAAVCREIHPLFFTHFREKEMHRTLLVCCLLPLAALAGASASRANVIYQSATMGAQDTFGDALMTTQFIGTRFHVSQTVAVSDIGGHIFGSGTLFGTIVSLSSSYALPTGSPFDSSLLAETLLTAHVALG